jgi:hypothetical protein
MDSGLDNNTPKGIVNGKVKGVEVDSNLAFWLHSKVTPTLILILQIGMIMFVIGSDIDAMVCMSGNKEVDDSTFRSFCWSIGTYIVHELLNKTPTSRKKQVSKTENAEMSILC